MTYYFDHNATSFIDDDTLELILNAHKDLRGNPSSVHALGRKAKAQYLKAKDKLGSYFKVKSNQVIFVQSATQALNWLLTQKHYKHIISTDLEHACVYNTLKKIEKNGTKVTYLHPGIPGTVSLKDIQSALSDDTDLVILGLANSETGIIQATHEISSFLKSKNIPIFIDAVGLFGKAPFEYDQHVTAYVISSHKIHGPKGIAALIHSNPSELTPLTYGGHQENSKYAGTENLPAAIGFSHAVDKLFDSPLLYRSIEEKRDYFEKGLAEQMPITVIGKNTLRTCNTSCIRFHGIPGETLLQLLDQNHIYASHGSACSSGALEPSRVLLNMGLSLKETKECLRFSFSKFTSFEELDFAIKLITTITSELNKINL
jgi:cysteine desulfurase